MRSRFLLLAIASLIAVVDTGAQTTTWRQCLSDSSPAAAISACTSIIILDPRNDGAFVNRGIAYRRAGDIERAIKDYDEAIRLDSHYAQAYNNRGIIFLEMDEVDRAIADFNKAIAEEPDYANAFRNRGLAWLHQRLFDRANEDFDEASRLSHRQAVH